MNGHEHDFSQQGDDAGFCECGAIQYGSIDGNHILENDD